MAWKLAELFVEITGSTGPISGALTGLRGQLVGLLGTGRMIGAQLADAIVGPMLGIGSLGALAGAGVVGALGIGLMKAVRASSDLNETVARTEQVFGSATDKVTRGADEMARKFGVSKREFLDASSMFGLIAQGAGIAADRSAEMSVSLARLAADAASFYNTRTDVALEKIRAGLVGESEPLRAFGVMLSEDAVKAKALALGLARPGQELTNAMKIMARYQLIQDGLAKANGDLERTGGGWANQTRMLSGNLENLSALIGDEVMPVFTGFLTRVNTLLGWTIDHIDQLKAAVGFLLPQLRIAAELWGGGAEADAERKARDERRKGIDDRNAAMARQIAADEKAAQLARHRPKGFQGGLEEFAKDIQKAAFGGAKQDVAKQQLEVAKQQNQALQRIDNKIEPPAKKADPGFLNRFGAWAAGVL
jgi:hypothetical protein